MTLPSGRRVWGWALRSSFRRVPPPTFALHLLGAPPPVLAWDSRWIRWLDFRLPTARADVADALRDAGSGGRGRTGTALACLVVIDAGADVDAVAYVCERYDLRAVETQWQRRYVSRIASR